ncbi:DUF4132 domain-containing protein, partial [Actinomadura sp. CNU-125]|uniref:DUF4132 domain-containing protein n=1 Tax=Actinomadura sp. CNU-125 TaxID=1904961 RepID=UPI000A885701
LDAAASTVLDYGPRRFRVGFDEQFKPYVADADGKPRKTLPKPSAKDDPDLAPAAHRAWTELKKDVRTAVSVRIRDLEEAMLDERAWTPGEFREHLAGHPIVARIVRRLVWRTDAGAFRVAEDGTFADVRDDPFAPAETSRIGVAHPAHLGEDVGAWSEVFADYEILQPFRQLDRPAVPLTAPERDGDRLARFDGLELPARRVFDALSRTAWRFGSAEYTDEPWAWWPDSGGRWAWWPDGDDRRVVAEFRPGPWQEWEDWDDVDGSMTIEHVRASATPAGHGPLGDPVRFGDLNAVSVSEALAALTGGAP